MTTLLLLIIALIGATTIAFPALAQTDGLTTSEIAVKTRTDVYGIMRPFAVGTLINSGTDAYTEIVLSASAQDTTGQTVAEGIGYLVNACGAGLLPDFALQPGQSQAFEIPLDLLVDGAVPEAVTIAPDVTAVAAVPINDDPIPGIERVTRGEVVEVEWIDARALRFSTGCERDLFFEWDWWHYSGRTGTIIPVEHPRFSNVTPDMLRALNLEDPAFLANSFLTFPPEPGRIVYQDEVNRLTTADASGAFRHVLFDGLHNRSLQGIIWLEGNRFLAYYYGATGNPVIYFTATTDPVTISLSPLDSVPSVIVPGASPDGRRAVIAGTFVGASGERTGYFLKALGNANAPQLLFEAEPPGNNWPAPVFSVQSDANGGSAQEIIYIARPVDGVPRLQCFSLFSGGPRDLTPLPVTLNTEDRARMWLSPDARTLALAATGVNGGLWIVDLTALPTCQ